jgi:prephenate dehydrogenase
MVEHTPGQSDRLSVARVAIMGLGLMGGSLALAIKGRCALLMGVEPDQSTRSLAQELAVFDQISADPTDILPQSDLVILAAPVRTIIHLIHVLPELHPGSAVVLDIGSTKGAITRAMDCLPPRFNPIGGHPICGKTSHTLANADPSIYLAAPFVLTPLQRTSEDTRTLVEQLVFEIGSRSIWLSAEDHDRWVAVTSHLPYLLANALISIPPDEAVGVIGPGFRSTTRLADSSTIMMLDILKTNRENILQSLSLYRDRLNSLEEILESGNDVALEQVLAHGLARHADLVGTNMMGETP